jgi:phosphomethylpyrimidine synthase
MIDPVASPAQPVSCLDTMRAVEMVGANGLALTIGGNAPIRLVAPFGSSGPEDDVSGLADQIHAYRDEGADAVQELSTHGPYARMRKELIQEAGIPYGTVLAYEVHDRLAGRRSLDANDVADIVNETVLRQISDGVAYMTVHASLSRDLLSSTTGARAERAIPESSRAGGMLQTIMRRYGIDNPLHTEFPRIAAACGSAGVTISLGGSLRPAAIADALDLSHLAELRTQGVLVRGAHKAGASVILEGLSHGVPVDLEDYVRIAQEECGPIPVTALGPLTIDVAAGEDHVAAAIGLVFGAQAGLALVNVVTAKEHLAMPSTEDVCSALRAARVALHVVRAIREGRGAPQDRAMSEARGRLEWSGQVTHALFPALVESIIDRESLSDGGGCRICGRRCPLVLRRDSALCQGA